MKTTMVKTKTITQTTNKTRMMVNIAMMAAISFVLAFLEISVPLSPSFAKMDLSDLPALIAAFSLGPIAGVLVELIKNGLQLFTTSTAGIGELANFIMGGSFVFAAGLLYQKTKKTWLSCIIASIVIGIVAAATNYFILLPMFEQFMPMEAIIASFGEFIPFINTKLDVVLWNALPFNILKGLIVSVFTIALYKRLAPPLRGR